MSFISQIRKKLSSFDFQPFIPKTIVCLQEGYTKKLFFNDLFAGITVSMIALPLALAFALGSGLAPEKGLFTAIVAGFLVSLFSGSRVQVAGPTGSFVVIVLGVLERHGLEGLALATILASVILIIMGIAKCGILIRFIPYPVTTGFTAGVATVLFSSQIKDFCGLTIASPSAEFINRVMQSWQFLPSFNPYAFAIACASLGIIFYFRSKSKKIPGAILAVIITSLIVYFFDLPVDTIEKKYGAIAHSLPSPTLPKFSLDGLQAIFPDAIAIAILCAIESLLAAVVSDGMTGFRHKSNLELIAEGIGNFGSAIFGGLPAAGGISRATINIQMQGRTPFAGMFHSVVLLLFLLFLSPFAAKIPLATLAAILVFVAYNMFEVRRFKELLSGPKSDGIVLAATYLLILFFNLTTAVQVGVLLSAFMFLKHMTEKTTVKLCKILEEEEEETVEEKPLSRKNIPKGAEVFEIEGPFFFGVSDLLNEALRRLPEQPKTFILRLRTVPLIDSSGMHALRQFHLKCKELGIQFFITETRPDVMHILEKSSVVKTVGPDHFFPTLKEALKAAKT